jgi:hypothetical protein
MTTDEAVQWVKDNPDRVLHRSTGEGPCKEAELEALLKEALGLLGCTARSGFPGKTCLERGINVPCDQCAFLDRPDVKRWTE